MSSHRRLLAGEFDTLLDYADHRCLVRDAAILCLLHDSAMRTGDAVCVKPEHFSTDMTLVRVEDGKWRTERDEPDTLPVSRRTIERIEAYLPERHQGPGALFLTSEGNQLHQQHVRRLLARIGPKALGKHVYPRMLRRTGITEAALGTSEKSPLPMPIVQKFARHRSIQTTMTYIDVDERWAKDMREWMGA